MSITASEQPQGLPDRLDSEEVTVDATALLNLAGSGAVIAFALVVGAWLERAVRSGEAQPARELVRADGHPDTTPAEAFHHAEGAAAWIR